MVFEAHSPAPRAGFPFAHCCGCRAAGLLCPPPPGPFPAGSPGRGSRGTDPPFPAGPLRPGLGRAPPRGAAKRPHPRGRRAIKRHLQTQPTSAPGVRAAGGDGRCPTGLVAGFTGEAGAEHPRAGGGQGLGTREARFSRYPKTALFCDCHP